MHHLLLASSSTYRRELLSRLRLPFVHASPEIDETPLPLETAEALARRLAEQKTRALADCYPQHLIIGSDQVAVIGQRIVGKPLTFERAREQLQAANGQEVRFLTAVSLLNAQSGRLQLDCIPFSVRFRDLSDAQIDRYLEAEKPFDCAGSFKVEGLGISLFRSTEGSDLTSLIGLPLIRLVDMLASEGVEVP